MSSEELLQLLFAVKYDIETPKSALAKMQLLTTSTKANRFEVINHLPGGEGRQLVIWKDEPFTIETSVQDESRTIKIFLKEDS